jgi:5-methylcytosine-specific restriction endonuclease McrA
MPIAPPRLCGCGSIVPAGERCACQKAGDRARKARHDRHRPTARQRGYNHEWQKARTIFLAAHPHCAMCGKPATVVDHIRPHRGDDTLFWDRTNWQPLCAVCHNKHKQREERGQVNP